MSRVVLKGKSMKGRLHW